MISEAPTIIPTDDRSVNGPTLDEATGPEPEWNSVLRESREWHGLILILGASDTGKTTFCTELVKVGVAERMRVGVVDADVGQSEIGPPGCVSLAMPEHPFQRLSDLRAVASAFVGSVTPQFAQVEHLAAVCRIVHEARVRDARMIVCDTTGMADTRWSVRLKEAKLSALDPDRVVLMIRPRRGETPDQAADAAYGWLARTLRTARRPSLHIVQTDPAVRIRSQAMRAQRRAWKFGKALEGAEPRTWHLDDVALRGTWIGSGRSVPIPGLRQLSGRLGCGIGYAETVRNRLCVVADRAVDRDDLASAAMQLYGISQTALTLAANLDGLLVGLYDGDDRMLGLGILERLDSARRQITLRTAIHSYAMTSTIRFGQVRLAPNGDPIGFIRDGDV